MNEKVLTGSVYYMKTRFSNTKEFMFLVVQIIEEILSVKLYAIECKIAYKYVFRIQLFVSIANVTFNYRGKEL